MHCQSTMIHFRNLLFCLIAVVGWLQVALAIDADTTVETGEMFHASIRTRTTTEGAVENMKELIDIGTNNVKGEELEYEELEETMTRQHASENPTNFVSLWPFSHKDKNDTKAPSCSSYNSCSVCTDASWCHWCDKDQACHVMGSIHGCLYGSKCHGGSDDDNKKKDNETSGCSAHKTCSECALSSRLCHWCAHDNACHQIGSITGCVTGVDCYSNDRCKRPEPEPIEHTVFTQMGFVPMMSILLFGLLLTCCSTLCFCCAGGIKGAYDDLTELAMDAQNGGSAGSGGYHEPLLAQQQSRTQVPALNQSNDDQSGQEQRAAEEGANAAGDEYVCLGEPDDHHTDAETTPLVTESTPVAAEPNPNRVRRVPRHMQRMYQACVGCYVFTLVAIGGLVLAVMRYYPKIPQYNVCNDSVAWKSLIDSLTNMKVTADFEILASVSNPNHLDAALDMGRGTFTHNGAFVGTFDIPPVTVKAMSVTDLFIIAHLSPDKWDALALTAEYYRGKLILHVDVQTTIRIPAMADYSFATDLRDIVVHVNEMSDRHLCACPNWSDAKNGTIKTFNTGDVSLVLPPWMSANKQD